MQAFSLIRRLPWYRAEAFESGLRKSGYEVVTTPPSNVKPGDLLLIWNRYSHWHDTASKFEAQGGTVLVCENGYLGKGGASPKFDVHPKGPKPDSYYAIGLGFHNDHTRVLPGQGRFQRLGVELKPWRADGDHILICPNRSFGAGDRVMHPDWSERVKTRLQRETKRPVMVRVHPGNDEPKRSIYDDLRGCWAVYVWSSSVAGHALAEGVPCFIESPYQILKPASASGSPDDPVCPERRPHFETMARGQFTCQEISQGVPFALLRAAREVEVAASA